MSERTPAQGVASDLAALTDKIEHLQSMQTFDQANNGKALHDLDRRLAALASTVAELTRNMVDGFAQLDGRIAELRSGINTEVASRINRGHLCDGRDVEIHAMLADVKQRIAALESPGSAEAREDRS